MYRRYNFCERIREEEFIESGTTFEIQQKCGLFVT